MKDCFIRTEISCDVIQVNIKANCKIIIDINGVERFVVGEAKNSATESPSNIKSSETIEVYPYDIARETSSTDLKPCISAQSIRRK